MNGRIFQLNISAGGVPKLGTPEATVTELGLVGDEQRFTDIHGGPERALCLFSLERILALQAEGHPILPGSVGENITLSGLDWEKIIPGVRLALGNEVEVEITSFTSPCNTITQSFIAGEYQRISQKVHPGWSRLYARVLRVGHLSVGQRVELMNGESAGVSQTDF